MAITAVPGTRYLTVAQFCEAHPWPTKGAIKHFIFENRDGFDAKCVKRVGRRVLLDETAVFEWIAAQ